MRNNKIIVIYMFILFRVQLLVRYSVLYPGSRGLNTEWERQQKEKPKAKTEGPLASAIENLTSMLSTSLPCLHTESE